MKSFQFIFTPVLQYFHLDVLRMSQTHKSKFQPDLPQRKPHPQRKPKQLLILLFLLLLLLLRLLLPASQAKTWTGGSCPLPFIPDSLDVCSDSGPILPLDCSCLAPQSGIHSPRKPLLSDHPLCSEDTGKTR